MTVYVVDDDATIRESMDSLLRSVGLKSMGFASADAFLAHPRPDEPSCLVLDVRLPGISGLDLLRASSRTGHAELPPVIMITGHGDIPMSVRAMKAGAVEFLTKPFKPGELLAAIAEALARDERAHLHKAEVAELRQRYETLTRREHEVLHHTVSGQLNKQIAATLEVSEVTVKLHRGRVMRKMQARTLADLVRIVERLKAAHPGTDFVQGNG